MIVLGSILALGGIVGLAWPAKELPENVFVDPTADYVDPNEVGRFVVSFVALIAGVALLAAGLK